MREIRLSGSEGGGTGNSTGPPYPYPNARSILLIFQAIECRPVVIRRCRPPRCRATHTVAKSACR